jgi:hypothetical protein
LKDLNEDNKNTLINEVDILKNNMNNKIKSNLNNKVRKFKLFKYKKICKFAFNIFNEMFDLKFYCNKLKLKCFCEGL